MIPVVRDLSATLQLRDWCTSRAWGALLGFLTVSAFACGRNAATGGAGGSQGGAGAGGSGGVGGTDSGGGAGGDTATGNAGVGGDAAGAGGQSGAAGGGGSIVDGDAGVDDDAGSDARDAAAETQAPNRLRASAAQSGRLIGAALGAAHLSDPDYAATAAAQLNYATPENEMKWDATEATRDVFTFDAADAIVAFAIANDLQVKGHTLVWHSQLPSWVAGIQDTSDMRAAMVNHITQLALHFRGKVVAWDVVNEAMADGGQALRVNPFLQWIGASYIDEAFIAAHAADPEARLYYNDYGAEGINAKSDAVYKLVQGMLARGVPIHGVGLQMHTGPVDASPSAADVASNMQRLAALGLDVVISEMDVQICNGDLDAQGRRFHDIVAACVAQPACKAVTVWGVPDKYSWRNGQSCATPRPLLFDDDYLPKPAHAAVFNALLGL